jgi:hypothetical protein
MVAVSAATSPTGAFIPVRASRARVALPRRVSKVSTMSAVGSGFAVIGLSLYDLVEREAYLVPRLPFSMVIDRTFERSSPGYAAFATASFNTVTPNLLSICFAPYPPLTVDA